MKKLLNLSVSPELGYSIDLLKDKLAKDLHLDSKEDIHLIIHKRSIDARRKPIKVNLNLSLYYREKIVEREKSGIIYQDVHMKPSVIIVGAGPAGMFAALRLIELGLKPIIIERGKDVRARRRDLASITKDHLVNEDSNYCFGEGGAGTYSDGKLYTRSKKRGNVHRILEILHDHGAREEILFDAHPHIGTNKLPKVVTELRNTILRHGGEIHFEERVDELVISSGQLKGVSTNKGNEYRGIAVLIATGHSARDIFHMLHDAGIVIEFKPFALGVRIEHQQSLIDSIQYHCDSRGPYLPAAAYSLVQQTYFQQKQRGVFSFCMCPGGYIVPSATAPGEIVVNGMSPSRRDSRFSNSGIVVSVDEEEVKQYEKHGPLKGLYFQQDVEQGAFTLTGAGQTAPAQRMLDFVKRRPSTQLNETSYQPGVKSMDMYEVLPPFIANSLAEGFKAFGKKMKGYLTNEAQLIGIESRTSSPVRIPRDRETLEHIQVKRLFPSGEGAGYAGGIVSAAMDGERCAESIAAIYG